VVSVLEPDLVGRGLSTGQENEKRCEKSGDTFAFHKTPPLVA
jgi:hypothetical protein